MQSDTNVVEVPCDPMRCCSWTNTCFLWLIAIPALVMSAYSVAILNQTSSERTFHTLQSGFYETEMVELDYHTTNPTKPTIPGYNVNSLSNLRFTMARDNVKVSPHQQPATTELWHCGRIPTSNNFYCKDNNEVFDMVGEIGKDTINLVGIEDDHLPETSNADFTLVATLKRKA